MSLISEPSLASRFDWSSGNGFTASELRAILAGSRTDDLRTLLEAVPGVQVIEQCHCSDLSRLARRPDADLIVLDVQPDDNGQSPFVTSSLNIPGKPLILVARDPQFAVQAFEIQAVDFMVRPLDEGRVRQAIERARAELRKVHYGNLAQQMMGLLQQTKPQNQPDQLVFRINGRLVFLDLNDIDWIGAAAKHVKLNAGSESYLVRESIGQLSHRLDPERFVRIHRSVIVNVQRIKELQPCNAGEYIVILKNGKKLPCSRGYRAELERYISKCVRTANTAH